MFLFSNSISAQNEVSIVGDTIVCAGSLCEYTLKCNCECRQNYISNNLWTVKNGQIMGRDKNVLFVTVLWDDTNLNKSIEVELNDDVDITCNCLYKLKMEISYFEMPSLNTPIISNQQICQNDSLILSTTISNNPDNLIPEFEYFFTSDMNTTYSIDKSPGNEIVLYPKDFPEWQLGENLSFQSYVYVCGTKKISSEPSTPARFLNSPYIQSIDVTEIPPTCHGNKDAKVIIGSMTINDTVYNESNPYKPSQDTLYLLNRGQNPEYITHFEHELPGYEPGTDTLTFQMQDGRCITKKPVHIPEKPKIDLNSVPMVIEKIQDTDYHVSCKNGNNGRVSINPNNASFPYVFYVINETDDTIKYLGNLNDSNYTIENLSSGKHSITIVDNDRCKVSETITLNEPQVSLKFDADCNRVKCFNQSTGEIRLSIDDINKGTPNYNSCIYNIDGSDSIKHFIGTSLNDSFPALSAGFYGVAISDTLNCAVYDTLEITEPPQLHVLFDTLPPVCKHGKGTLIIHASGGTPNYEFQINDTGIFKTDSIYLLNPGIYNISARDNNACLSESVKRIPQISNPLELDCEIIPPTCAKNGDASVVFTAHNGYGNYIFNDENNNSIHSDVAIYDGLFQNRFYKFHLRDSVCSLDTIIFIHPNPDTVRISSLDYDSISCNGSADGKMSIHISNGYPDYQLFISSNDLTDTIHLDTNIYTISKLKADNYTLIVMDSAGCEYTMEQLISQPELMSVSWDKNDIQCFGMEDGSLISFVDGGNGDYSFIWTNESGDTISTVDRAHNLSSGEYTVSVIDRKDCKQVFYNGLMEGPKLIQKKLNTGHASCEHAFDGFVEVEFLDNFNNFHYELISEDDNDVIKSFMGQENFYYGELAPGKYKLEVAAGSCETLVSFTIKSGKYLLSIDSIKNPTCYGKNNGYAKFQASNSIRKPNKYKFHWIEQSSSEKYNGEMNEFFNLKPGIYKSYVTNMDESCFSDTIQFNLEQPKQLSISTEIKDSAACLHGTGKILVNTFGGTTPHSIDIVQVNNGFPMKRTQDDISAGSFYITLKDVTGCERTDTFDMPVSIQKEMRIEKIRDYTCRLYPGIIQIHITTNKSFRTRVNQKEIGIISNQDSIELYNLGNNNLQFIDSGGCTVDTTIHLSLINQLQVSKIIEPASCQLSNGGITLNVEGGIPINDAKPYQFHWNHSQSDTNTVNNLSSGIYDVNIRDSTGCSYHESIILNNINGPLVDSILVTPSYCNLNLGGAHIFASGGQTPYEFNWYDRNRNLFSHKSNKTEQLKTGKYYFKIIDAQNCHLFGEFDIHTDSNLYATYSKILLDSSDCGISNGYAEILSNDKILVKWSTGFDGKRENALPGNKYEVFQIIDSNQCIIVDSIYIPQKQGPTLNLENCINAYCGLANGTIKVNTNNGSEPYKYHWSHTLNNNNSLATNIYPGQYWVFSEDQNGCTTDTGFIMINDEPAFNITIKDRQSTTCSYSNDGKISLEVGNAANPLTFTWDNAHITYEPFFFKLSEGQHFVIIRDDRGCLDTINYYMPSPSELDILDINIQQPLCYGNKNGSIDVWPTGGNGSYNYFWDNGNKQKSNENLEAGNYLLYLKDKLGCTDTFEFALVEPDSLFIMGIDDKYTLCEGQELNLKPYSNWNEYYWYKDQKLQTVQHTFTLTDSGKYLLKTKDKFGCEAHLEFESTIRNDLLNAEFLVNSSAVVGDTITLIDITWPEAEFVEWILPDEMHVIGGRLNHYCNVIPTEEGVYNVGLTVKARGCSDKQFKLITIYGNELKKLDGNVPVEGKSIKRINIHPNPNDGHFSVDIAFNEIKDLTLEVINLSTSTIYYQQQFSGSDKYKIEINQPYLQEGVYALKILTNLEVYTYLIVKM